MKELCEITGIKKTITTPYHAMGNGMCQRFNRTLLGMLGTLDPDKKPDWKAHIGTLIHAYNATRHESTGQSPFFLMYGRQPRLPIDVVLGLPDRTEGTGPSEYGQNLRKRLQDSYLLASSEAGRARRRQKGNYDNRVQGAVVEPGDSVLVLAFSGKHKIADKWEECPYIVLAQPSKEVPVYVLEREDGVGPRKPLH